MIIISAIKDSLVPSGLLHTTLVSLVVKPGPVSESKLCLCLTAFHLSNPRGIAVGFRISIMVR